MMQKAAFPLPGKTALTNCTKRNRNAPTHRPQGERSIPTRGKSRSPLRQGLGHKQQNHAAAMPPGRIRIRRSSADCRRLARSDACRNASCDSFSNTALPSPAITYIRILDAAVHFVHMNGPPPHFTHRPGPKLDSTARAAALAEFFEPHARHSFRRNP